MPSRKFILIVLALTLVGGAIFYVGTYEKKQIVYRSPEEESVAKAAAILTKDADEDGLKDWEEELWKTDPKNPDTDGDKTKDGEEIRLSRDPLKPAPDDMLATEDVTTKTTLNTTAPTATDHFSRDFFARYLAIKQSGKEFTAEEEKKLFEEVFTNPPPLEAVKTFTEEELNITEDNSTEPFRAYGNVFVATLQKFVTPPEKRRNEFEAVQEAIEADEPVDTALLESRASLYRSALAELLAVRVPRSAAANHRDLLNAISGLAQATEGMKNLTTDPIKAVASVGYYPHAFSLFFDTLDRIASQFQLKKIPFEKDEPGHLLLGASN